MSIIDDVEPGKLGSFTIDAERFSHAVRVEWSAEPPAGKTMIEASFAKDPSDGDATISLNGQGAKIELDPLPGQRSHRLDIAASLTQPGSYQIALTITHDGGSRQAFELTVGRSAPTLELVGAKDKTLALQTDTAAFETELALRTTTKAPAEQVKVLVNGLLSPDGNPVAVTVSDADTSATGGTLDGLGY